MNAGAVVMITSVAVQSFAIRCLRSRRLLSLRLSQVTLYAAAFVGPLALGTAHYARIERAASELPPTLGVLSAYLASAIALWSAARRSIVDQKFDDMVVAHLLAVAAAASEDRRGAGAAAGGLRAAAPPRSPFEAPARPHPSDPRADDRCPICCDDLDGVDVALLVDGGGGGGGGAGVPAPEARVRVHAGPRQLSKCRRCGSVAHTQCAFAMMIARAGAGNPNPCSVCQGAAPPRTPLPRVAA